MRNGLTIGVLSTSFGGTYFGRILGGIKRATVAAGGRIIAIQTLDAGTVNVDLSDPPEFRHPVAWDHISAFVIVLNAVDREYLTAIQATGKPVVMVSDDLDGFPCPVVLPDNRAGVREAVMHLVEHGHRTIAFAGNPAQRDLRERYEAYREALLEAGIQPRPDLLFDTGDNQETGGERAGRAMIAAGMPSTAVIAGNDYNAIGLMRTLTTAGYRLPQDQAIVGFDDIDGVVYLTPSLSSVRQSFDEIGSRAVEILLTQLDGREVPAGCYHVATPFVPRESCGCPDTLALGNPAATAPRSVTGADDLAAHLAAILEGTQVDPGAGAAIRRGADRITAAIQAAADGVPGPDSFELRKVLADLHGLQQRPESLVEIMRCVRTLGRHMVATARNAGDDVTAERVENCTDEIVAALGQSEARAQYYAGNAFAHTLNTQYQVSMNLLRSHEEGPRTLAWIEGTHARGGCLGLWSAQSADAAPADRTLDIVSMFQRGGPNGMLPALPVSTPRSFPPPEVIRWAELTADDMVFVAPMKVNASDWGMLAIVGPIEAWLSTGREMMNQWTALLTIALDHEAVLESLREREEWLQYAALYDQLTGLANRTLFMERLQQSIARAERRSNYQFAVLLLDLDGFKRVNDSLGHLAGDQLLVQVAQRIKECTRDADTAARFGGDEFAILLHGLAGPEWPVAVAERIHAALTAPFRLGDEEVVVSSSIGISLSATGYAQAEDIIRDADTAMYSAKGGGKGSHTIFNVDMHAKAVARLRTEADLRRALELDELEAHYQPIVRLDTGEVAAVEALMRWRHPTLGLIPPAEFLPIAEETGLMLPMGRWMLMEACAQLRRWHGVVPDAHNLRVSVNVSNRQFWHGRLLEDVRDCLRMADLEPHRLALEITEGVIMHDVKQARRMLAELHEMGVELHIDDFGTGYSSLEALYHLPIDALKIDRSFVSRLGTDERSAELARTIVQMGTNLGLEVIAEGIETTGQRDQLRQTDCTYGQGYLFSRPVAADDAAEFLCSAALRNHHAHYAVEYRV
ncbi:EAL domain-containing protein [Jidongwangia harbinensis]|uniref:EAL domain-containing protein n=1 Tax=Jidongwangia harbinensis TaxID=2878561 RepID=UPI001CD9D0F5|nr:EAL domain-containing protein [Jidongwangia harbinensis]MCA2218195.1 EAL domain-containing protein [Jidongwangia harbinensis]